jgi:hypothetical protein
MFLVGSFLNKSVAEISIWFFFLHTNGAKKLCGKNFTNRKIAALKNLCILKIILSLLSRSSLFINSLVLLDNRFKKKLLCTLDLKVFVVQNRDAN